MKLILFVGTGSFIGGILRYLVSLYLKDTTHSFPINTLFVNITGCYLIGIIYAMLVSNNISYGWHLFLITGILGGFTTFSAFSHESVMMLQNGQFIKAVLYITLSIILGIIATYLGILSARIF